MRIKVLTSGQIAGEHRTIGDKFSVKDTIAHDLISANPPLAEPLNKEKYKAFLTKLEEQKKLEAEKEEELKARKEEEELKALARQKGEELYELLEKIALVDPNFSGEILEIFGCEEEEDEEIEKTENKEGTGEDKDNKSK